MTLGPKIWTALPKFSEYIDLWFGPNVDVTYTNPLTIEYFKKLLP